MVLHTFAMCVAATTSDCWLHMVLVLIKGGAGFVDEHRLHPCRNRKPAFIGKCARIRIPQTSVLAEQISMMKRGTPQAFQACLHTLSR